MKSRIFAALDAMIVERKETLRYHESAPEFLAQPSPLMGTNRSFDTGVVYEPK